MNRFQLSIEEARAIHRLLGELDRRGYDDVALEPLKGLYARLSESNVLYAETPTEGNPK